MTNRCGFVYVAEGHIPNLVKIGVAIDVDKRLQSPPIQHEAAKRIEELEAALWIALDGREIVVHEGVGCGRIEFITMDDGRTLVRRARETI